MKPIFSKKPSPYLVSGIFLGLSWAVYFFQYSVFNHMIRSLFEFNIHNAVTLITTLISEDFFKDWLTRSITTVVIISVVLLIEVIVFYVLISRLIAIFRTSTDKQTRLITTSYRVLFWGSLALILLGLVMNLSSLLELWSNIQTLQQFRLETVITDLKELVINAPLQSIGDVQHLVTDIQSYIRTDNVLLETKQLASVYLVNMKYLLGLWQIAYPLLLALLTYAHLGYWWKGKAPKNKHFKITFTIEK